jgi:hypothetical protein
VTSEAAVEDEAEAMVKKKTEELKGGRAEAEMCARE